MKTLLSGLLLLVTITFVNGGCPAVSISNKIKDKKLRPFTKTNSKGKPLGDKPCWWDLTRDDCGDCKNDGKQCGYPMHKWCQSPKAKTVRKHRALNIDIKCPLLGLPRNSQLQVHYVNIRCSLLLGPNKVSYYCTYQIRIYLKYPLQY